ncbi:type VII secretion protein EsaA [Enterococcus moraviensis]|nr:type VII secretion protein EsaA [Enterococcus moraviensis]
MLKSVWMVVILLIMLIFMNRDFTDISAQKDQEEKDMRLNIALVNEDAGVNKNNIEYNLGADYVKKIEKDVTYNWFTVSRGIGENGLKNGTYNLLVTIPSNFSSKLLELDSEAPEKVQVNYKINANGNATLENESKSVGRKIVNDLNQQLVDLYVVSIMDNLFTAQRNIEKVYANQTSSVQEFQDVLYQPTLNFKDYLPSITSQSKSALQANDLLANTLGSNIQGTDSLVNSHKDYSSLLEKLLEERAKGQLTYDEFVNQLLEARDTVTSDSIADMFRQLQETGKNLQNEFNPNGMSDTTIKQMDALNQQLADAKAAVTEQQEKLTEISDNYFDRYKEPFFASLGIKETGRESTVTLNDVLKKANKEYPPSDDTGFNVDYKKWMEERLALLPFRSITFNLNPQDDIFRYAKAPYGDGQPFAEIQEKFTDVLGKVSTLNEKIDENNKENNLKEAPIDFDMDPIKASESPYYKNLKEAYDNLTDTRAQLLASAEGRFQIRPSNIGSGGTIIISDIPAGITDVAISGIGPIVADGEYPFLGNIPRTVTYKFTDEYDETAPAPKMTIKIGQPEVSNTRNALFTAEVSTPESSEEETTTTSSEETENTESSQEEIPKTTETRSLTSELVQSQFTLEWEQNIDTSAFLDEDYQHKKRLYSEQVGKTLDLYDSINSELAFYENYQFEQFGGFLKLDLTDAFKQILNETFLGGDYKVQVDHLEALKLKADSLETQSEVVGEKMSNVLNTTSGLNEAIGKQAELVENGQKQIQEALSPESKVSSWNSQTDSGIESAKTTLATLYQQSQAIKDASEMNVKEAETVKSVFTSFDQEVNTAQKNGEELSTNADVIMANLNDELANNNDFVSAFIKVLSNAQKDGVPNNTLLQFIANPVHGKSEATIKTTEVNEPFTWILIMYTLSLFIAYLFATQPVVRKVKDKFKREQLWFKDNIMETIILSLSAIGIGLILGILSVSELSIVKESQIVWVMMVILFMLIFSLLNHYALKQFHIAGFGFSLFLFISYVFVTNAIGKTKGNNPMVEMIRSINPLSIGENNLADILARNALDIVHIILYVLAITALFAFNIFIWKPRRKAKEVAKK